MLRLQRIFTCSEVMSREVITLHEYYFEKHLKFHRYDTRIYDSYTSRVSKLYHDFMSHLLHDTVV